MIRGHGWMNWPYVTNTSQKIEQELTDEFQVGDFFINCYVKIHDVASSKSGALFNRKLWIWVSLKNESTKNLTFCICRTLCEAGFYNMLFTDINYCTVDTAELHLNDWFFENDSISGVSIGALIIVKKHIWEDNFVILKMWLANLRSSSNRPNPYGNSIWSVRYVTYLYFNFGITFIQINNDQIILVTIINNMLIPVIETHDNFS